MIADRLPETHRARQRDDERDVSRLAPEARRELLHERLRRSDPGAQVGERAGLRPSPLGAGLGLARGGGEAQRQRARVEREPRAPRRVVARGDELAHLLAAAGALVVVRCADDRATSVGTTWRLGCTGTSSARRSSEKPTPRREGVAPVAVRSRSGSRSSSSSSSVSTSPPSSSTPSSTRRSVDESFSISSASRAGLAKDVPRGLERQRDGRRRRPSQVVRRDGAHRLERRLREEGAHAARVFPLPRPQLDQVRGRKNELDAPARRAREHEPAREERLEGGGQRRDLETPRASATRCRSSTAAGQPRRIAQLGQRDERARDLRRRVDPLRGIDANAQARDERVELPLRQRAQDVGELVARVGGRCRGRGAVIEQTNAAPMIFPKGLARAGAHGEARCLHRMRPPRRAVRSPAPARQATGRARLLWPGRVWEPGAPRHAAVALPATTEVGGDARETVASACSPSARLLQGDALEVALALGQEGLAGQVDLVYVDPPFASQAAYVNEARLDGPADGRKLRAVAYEDHWDEAGGAYLDMLAPRLEALANLLSSRGTLWVHVDWRASYLVRLLLDEILGREAFIERDRVAPRAEPGASGREPPVRAHARHADRLRHAGREARAPHAARAHRAVDHQDRRRGTPLHHRTARRLHRRVDRAPGEGGARASDAERQGVHQVLPREGRERGVVPRAPRRRAVDRRAAAASLESRRAHRVSDPEAAGAARSHRDVRYARGGPGGRRLRRQRHDRRERARARASLRARRFVAAVARVRPGATPAGRRAAGEPGVRRGKIPGRGATGPLRHAEPLRSGGDAPRAARAAGLGRGHPARRGRPIPPPLARRAGPGGEGHAGRTHGGGRARGRARRAAAGRARLVRRWPRGRRRCRAG